MEQGFFASMAPLNKVAFGTFVAAKVAGFLGVILGFGEEYRMFGGYFLWGAFGFIATSITCAIVQSSIDKKKFAVEDESESHLRRLANVKAKLEDEIKELESRRAAVNGLMIRRG